MAVTAALALSGACANVIKIPDRSLGDNLVCADGKCSCAAGFGDCDGDPTNGCEASLAAAPNCGACGNTCANGVCSTGPKTGGGAEATGLGVCTCSTGFEDCDTDPKNGCEAELATAAHDCGTCGHDCEKGTCGAGSCGGYALGSLTYSYTLGIDGSFLYIGNCTGPGAVTKIPVTGGAFSAASDPTIMDCALNEALSGPTLYWSGKDGTYETTLASMATTPLMGSLNDAGYLGTTTGYLYGGADGATDKTSQLVRQPLAGGAITPVSTNTVTTATTAGATAFWADATALWRMGDADVAPTQLALVTDVFGMTADAASVYVALTGGGIETFPVAGGAPTMILPMASSFALASDGTTLFYFDFSAGTVNSFVLATGAHRVLATGVQAPSGQALAFDEDAVYWLAGDSVYRMVR